MSTHTHNIPVPLAEDGMAMYFSSQAAAKSSALTDQSDRTTMNEEPAEVSSLEEAERALLSWGEDGMVGVAEREGLAF